MKCAIELQQYVDVPLRLIGTLKCSPHILKGLLFIFNFAAQHLSECVGHVLVGDTLKGSEGYRLIQQQILFHQKNCCDWPEHR